MNRPLELLTEIVRISQRPVVASNVQIRRLCPPGYIERVPFQVQIKYTRPLQVPPYHPTSSSYSVT